MNPPGVYKINLEGGVGRFDSLERLNPEGYFLMPMINPDASSVLFWGRQEGEKGFNIWRNDLNGKDPVKLTDHRAVSGHPFWNSDASRVVFFSTLGVSPETDWNMADQFKLKRSPRNIWIMGRNGENPIRLTEGPYVDERPCISPDGRTVVFVSDRSGYMNLWSVSTETGELRQITKHQKRDYRPIFSPKGDCLAFFSTNNSKGMDDLCLMKWPDGKQEFPLPEGLFKWVHGPFWLHRERTILFHARSSDGKDCSLHICRMDDMRTEKIQLPGIPVYTHGSLDAKEKILVFDTQTK